MNTAARAATAGCWPMATRIGSTLHMMAQAGRLIRTALQKPCRTVLRTSRTACRFWPSVMAIMGMVADTRPMLKFSSDW